MHLDDLLLVPLHALEAARGFQDGDAGLDLLAAVGVVLQAPLALAHGPVEVARIVAFRQLQDLEVERAETAVGERSVGAVSEGAGAGLALVGVALDELGLLRGRDGDGLAAQRGL